LCCYASDHLSGAIIAHVPIITASTRYDSSVNKKVMVNMAANKDFIKRVEQIFPDKAAAKIIVSCSDGRNRAIQALEVGRVRVYST
jgi:hypothetical protein